MIEERQKPFNEVDLPLSFHEKCMDRGYVFDEGSLYDSQPKINRSQND